MPIAKPIELKRKLGNPGSRPLLEPLTILPAVVGGAPPYPTGLRKPGKETWDRLWRVGNAWLSPESDLAVMTMLCQAWDERTTLRGLIRKEGRTTVGSMGQTVSHPYVGQLGVLEIRITRWLGLCGFTPSDRSRLGLAEVRRHNELEAFLARRNRGV